MALQEVYLRSARICRGSSVKRPVDGSCCSIEACTALPLWPPTANSCSCGCINTRWFRALQPDESPAAVGSVSSDADGGGSATQQRNTAAPPAAAASYSHASCLFCRMPAPLRPVHRRVGPSRHDESPSFHPFC